MSQQPPPYPGTEKGGPPPNPAYPQQQPGPAPYPAQYQPAQYNPPYGGQQTSTVVVTQPAYTVVQHFRESPVRIKCQFCQADVVTSTYYETGTLTWVACFVIAIVGCWLGCCLIPFCMDACKDVVHQCPNCHQQIHSGGRPIQKELGYPPAGGYPPPPPQQGGYPQMGYPPGPYQQQPAGFAHPGVQTVVVTQPATIQQFRETPVHTRCPHCQAEVVTGTVFETGTLAWVVCIFLCIFGCDAGCCLIPFCMDSCKDVVHTCPNCQQVVSRYNRM